MVHTEESRLLMQHAEDPDEDLAELCWICLEDESIGELKQSCRCPTLKCHAGCLARWQLQSAGKQEENSCRFCGETLPDWRPVLTPGNLKPSSMPLITVRYNDKQFKIRVPPGAEGFEKFRRTVENIVGADIMNDGYQITFACARPDAVDKNIEFSGMPAFNAAMHCAAVTAATRSHQRTGGGMSWWKALTHRGSNSSRSYGAGEMRPPAGIKQVKHAIQDWFKKASGTPSTSIA